MYLFLMKLVAEHFDGFTQHLVSWTLTAQENTGTVVASWRGSDGRREKCFTIDFPDSRIEEIKQILTGLKPRYDGHVDDFPTYSLCVTTDDEELKTVIHAGIDWPDDEKADVDAFMSVWRPIRRDVEKLMALPGRK